MVGTGGIVTSAESSIFQATTYFCCPSSGVRFPPPPLRKYPESHAVGASHLRGVPRRFQSRDLRGYGSRARTTAPSSTDPSGSTQPAPHGKRQVGVLAFDAARPDPSPPRPFQKPCRGLCSLFPPLPWRGSRPGDGASRESAGTAARNAWLGRALLGKAAPEADRPALTHAMHFLQAALAGGEHPRRTHARSCRR